MLMSCVVYAYLVVDSGSIFESVGSECWTEDTINKETELTVYENHGRCIRDTCICKGR